MHYSVLLIFTHTLPRKAQYSIDTNQQVNLHGRPQNNNHSFGIYENIKLVLINYTLLGLIEHHGVFNDSGHYVR